MQMAAPGKTARSGEKRRAGFPETYPSGWGETGGGAVSHTSWEMHNI